MIEAGGIVYDFQGKNTRTLKLTVVRLIPSVQGANELSGTAVDQARLF
jgi:hypothetical protein